MGRWGSDVVALACIAGGAVVGSGVTAALFARSVDGEAHRVEVVCASESPRVIVQLSSGAAASSTRTIHVRSHSACGESIHVDVAGLEERMEEARQRMDEARLRVEEARGRIEEAQFRIAEVREVREIDAVRTEEIRATLDKLKAETDRARASGGND